MKLLCCVMSLCWLWGVCLRAQTESPLHASQVTNGGDYANDLSLNAEVFNQTYCHVDLDTFSVQMLIKLRFTNVSDHNVILSRRIESPAIVRVAKTVQDAQSGTFEYNPTIDYFPHKISAGPRFAKNPDSRLFITLSPKESYETTVTTAVVGAVDKSRVPKMRGLLDKGSHVLQLGVSTWPYQWPHFKTSADSQDLAKRWRPVGHLVTSTLFSDFAHFIIPDVFQNPQCKP